MKELFLKIKAKLAHGNKGVTLGRRSRVFRTARLCAKKGGRIIIGGASIINDNVFICANGGHIDISENVTVNRNSIIVSKCGVTVGARSSIGPNVCIYDHNHKIDKNGFYKSEFTMAPIVIGKNVWIAANCIILKGVAIGDNSIVGAGCVVSTNIPPNTLVKSENTLQMTPLRD